MRRYSAYVLLLCGMLTAAEKLRTLKPGFNMFSPEQDAQLGKEAAAEVEKTKPIVRNSRLDAYVNQLGQKLAASPRAGKFPFSFEVVSDSSVNAFALPGGPMFINTQTFLAAQNEAQLAGVMAHEMSHVALRHGTHEASKGQALQVISGMAGSVAGQGIFGKMAQAGIGLGANSLLLHYSRSAEAEADYNGAQIMADAGYNPHYLATFFQQLETKGSEGKMAQFLSDHPTPGNRVKAVDDEVKLMPAQNFIADSPQFHQIQALVRSLPPPPAPKMQPAQQPR
jgi:predicted Zn-dependent protease